MGFFTWLPSLEKGVGYFELRPTCILLGILQNSALSVNLARDIHQIILMVDGNFTQIYENEFLIKLHEVIVYFDVLVNFAMWIIASSMVYGVKKNVPSALLWYTRSMWFLNLSFLGLGTSHVFYNITVARIYFLSFVPFIYLWMCVLSLFRKVETNDSCKDVNDEGIGMNIRSSSLEKIIQNDEKFMEAKNLMDETMKDMDGYKDDALKEVETTKAKFEEAKTK